MNLLPLCPVCGQPFERAVFGLFDGYDKTVTSPIYYCTNGDCVEGEARAKVEQYLFSQERAAVQNEAIRKANKEEARRQAAALERLIQAELAMSEGKE